jgi:hypothetical protein
MTLLWKIPLISEWDKFSIIATFLFDPILSVDTLCLGLLVWIQFKVYNNLEEYLSTFYRLCMIDSIEPK